MSKAFIPSIGSPPAKDLIVDKSIDRYGASTDVNHRNWLQYFNSISSYLNSAEYYGNPSELLNSDFNWNRGVPASITQADGNGALFSEKWQIFGAASATYKISHVLYSGDELDPTGSLYYTYFDISNYPGNGTNSDFFAYQRQPNTIFSPIRRFSGRNIAMSISINNLQTKDISGKFEIACFYNPSIKLFDGNTFSIPPGQNFIADRVTIDELGTTAIGANPYVEFRFVICNLGDSSASFNLGYLKAEIADNATVLYVDHALEKTRIDNS